MTRPPDDILRELVTYFHVVNHGEPRGPYATLAGVYRPANRQQWCFAWARNSYDEASLGHLSRLLNEARAYLGLEQEKARPAVETVISLDTDVVGLKK